MRNTDNYLEINEFYELMFYSESHNILTINNANDLELLTSALKNECVKVFITGAQIGLEFQKELFELMDNDNNNEWYIPNGFGELNSEQQKKLEEIAKNAFNNIKCNVLDKIEKMIKKLNNIKNNNDDNNNLIELIKILQEYKLLIEKNVKNIINNDKLTEILREYSDILVARKFYSEISRGNIWY